MSVMSQTYDEILDEAFKGLTDEIERLRASHDALDALLKAAKAALLDGSLTTLPPVHFLAFVAAIAKAEELTP